MESNVFQPRYTESQATALPVIALINWILRESKGVPSAENVVMPELGFRRPGANPRGNRSACGPQPSPSSSRLSCFPSDRLPIRRSSRKLATVLKPSVLRPAEFAIDGFGGSNDPFCHISTSLTALLGRKLQPTCHQSCCTQALTLPTVHLKGENE